VFEWGRGELKFLIIARKEIIDITRDRRTIIMMIVVPLFLIPVLIGTITKISFSQAKKASEKHLKVRFFGQEFAPDLFQAFINMDKVTMLNQIPEDSVESYIQNEYLDAAIYVNREYQESIDQNKQAPIIIKFKGTDSFGITRDRIKSLLTAQENQIITKRMNQLNLKPDIVKAYQIEYKDIASTQEKLGKFVGGFLPYFFIIFGFMGAMYPALDLGAGEKERGTLETILSSPATRLDVVLGEDNIVSRVPLSFSPAPKSNAGYMAPINPKMIKKYGRNPPTNFPSFSCVEAISLYSIW
jgi:sodium transport system permease protein